MLTNVVADGNEETQRRRRKSSQRTNPEKALARAAVPSEPGEQSERSAEGENIDGGGRFEGDPKKALEEPPIMANAMSRQRGWQKKYYTLNQRTLSGYVSKITGGGARQSGRLGCW